jgi:hypothetical protein
MVFPPMPQGAQRAIISRTCRMPRFAVGVMASTWAMTHNGKPPVQQG